MLSKTIDSGVPVPDAPAVPPSARYRFDDFEVDILNGTLQRDGAEIHLRHKTFQVLRYLIEQRSRTVPKQELWRHIWDDCAVTDDTLVQCVKEIRRALADDPREPRYVKTASRLGYRFVAEVVDANAAGADARPEADAPQIVVSALSVPPQESRQWTTVSRALSQLVVAALSIAAVTMVVVAAARSTRASGVAAIPGKTSVAVMYLTNESGSTEYEWLRQGLADMLISGLARSERLTLIGRQQLDAALARSGGPVPAIDLPRARKLAGEIHADRIVLGTFGRLGDRIRVDVQMYDSGSGQLVASERLVADKRDAILSEIDLLSLRLAARLGGPQPAGRLVDVMTDNLEAYRAYSLGVEQAHALRVKEAIALFESAVRLDPRFAMAHARIGYTYGITWGITDKAKPYLEKAFALSDRLTPRDRLNIAAWYAIVNADYVQAIQLYRQVVAAYPYDTEAYLRLGRLLMGEEQFDEAVTVLLQGLTVDAYRPELYNQLAGAYFDWKKYDRALEYATRYVDVSRGEANAYDTLGLAHLGVGDYAAARGAFERALALRADFEVARIHLANTYLREGKYAAAEDQYRRYLQIAPGPNERDRGLASLAWLASIKGQDHESRSYLDQMSEESAQDDFHRILNALQSGDIVAARTIRARLPDGSNRGSRLTRRFDVFLDARIALSAGERDEAMRLFTELLRHPAPMWSNADLETALADALLEIGRYDEAVKEYARVSALWPRYGPAVYGRAEAFRRGGRHAEALEAYQTFLTVWRDADADIPSVISAGRYVADAARR